MSSGVSIHCEHFHNHISSPVLDHNQISFPAGQTAFSQHDQHHPTHTIQINMCQPFY